LLSELAFSLIFYTGELFRCFINYLYQNVIIIQNYNILSICRNYSKLQYFINMIFLINTV